MIARRSYHSPRREEVAAATRNSVLAAARELFVTHGYARVTVAEIARHAGVALKTVYASAGGKADMLKELLADAIQDSRPEDTLAVILRTTDLTEALRVLAHGTRVGNESHQVTIDIMYAAMGVQDDAQALWEQGTASYRAVLREVAAHLRSLGRTTQDVDRLADILWFCFGTGAWRTFVRDCGWSWDDAEDWLARQAVAMVTDTST